MRYHVLRFARFLERHELSLDVETLSARTLRAFIVEPGESYSLTTLNGTVRGLKTLFAFATRERLITTNPIERVQPPKLPDTDIPVFGTDEVERLLAICGQDYTGVRDRAVILLLFDSGIRASELCTLSDEDIDWELGLVRVLGKGAKVRQAPVSPTTLRAIKRYQRVRDKRFPGTTRLFVNRFGEGFTRSGLLQLIERRGDAAGLDAHPHKFRHSFAVQALRNGAREYDVQDCLGHTTLSMTKRYARQSATDLARRHQQFSPVNTLSRR
jgi:site-specific recombinase XerD